MIAPKPKGEAQNGLALKRISGSENGGSEPNRGQKTGGSEPNRGQKTGGVQDPFRHKSGSEKLQYSMNVNDLDSNKSKCNASVTHFGASLSQSQRCAGFIDNWLVAAKRS